MAKDTRSDMVRAAAHLLGRVGLEGTTFSTVLEESGAPRGSIYHHFPDGKTQLVDEAVTWVGDRLTNALRAMAGRPASDVTRAFLAAWRAVLTGSECQAGCVVAAVTTDGSDDAVLAATTRRVFEEWTAALADALRAGGVPSRSARPLASLLIAGVEGALLLARAAGDVESFDVVAGELQRRVDEVTGSPKFAGSPKVAGSPRRQARR